MRTSILTHSLLLVLILVLFSCLLEGYRNFPQQSSLHLQQPVTLRPLSRNHTALQYSVSSTPQYSLNLRKPSPSIDFFPRLSTLQQRKPTQSSRHYATTGAIQSEDSLKIIIAGAPASGKGTQCETIKENFGVVHLSTGDILRAAVKEGTELGIKAKAFMDAGKLVPDELIIDVVCDRLQQSDCLAQGWLLDGFPRTRAQADALSAAGITPDCFILLEVPEEVLIERVEGRRTDPVTQKIYHLTYKPPETEEIAQRLIQRSDDTAEKVKLRFRDFQSHINAIQICYAQVMTTIDGTQKSDAVSQQVTTCLQAIADSKKEKNQDKKKKKNDDDKDSSDDAAQTTPITLTDNEEAKGRSGSSGFSMSMSIINKNEEKKSSPIKIAAGMLVLWLMDTQWRQVARRVPSLANVPSSLSGMLLLFLSFTSMHSLAPQSVDQVFYQLSYALGFLRQWLVFCFAPPVIALPLKLPLLRHIELPLIMIAGLGLLASMTMTGKLADMLLSKNKTQRESSEDKPIMTPTAPLPQYPHFTKPLFASSLFLATQFMTPLPLGLRLVTRKAFQGASTATGFLLGQTIVPKPLQTYLHPIIVTAAYTLGALSLLQFTPALTGVSDFTGIVQQYYGTTGKGVGDFISSLLGPAILGFGLQLFQYRDMLQKSALVMSLSTVFGASFGLLSSALLVRAFGLGSTASSAAIALSPLTRCITTPLALAGAGLTGADPSLSAFFVVITGMLGAMIGESLLKKVDVTHPLPVGIAMGSAAHGLGTAAVAKDPYKFAAGVVSMTLTGLWTVGLLCLEPVRSPLIKLALGG